MTTKPPAPTTKKRAKKEPRKVAYPRLVDAIEDFCESSTKELVTIDELVQALSDAYMNEARS